MKPQNISINDLWNAVPAGGERGKFSAEQVRGLPLAAQRYLRHAIAEGTPLASAVRLKMRGEIKLNGRWWPFKAEQVNHWGRGFIWAATARMNGLPVRGSDRLVDGYGAMLWKLLGLFPVVNASGPQLARSAAGRINAEVCWLPAALAHADVCWRAADETHAVAHFNAHGEPTDLEMEIDPEGRMKACKLRRWGDLNSGTFRYEDFGGEVDEERTFGGYTIPSRLRVGWFYGSQRFADEGDFFHATVEWAEFK
ncbi:MAG TPA: DUF6544 family protein, partial [Anaerolineaceae bacterium]|nr:DUF6544 family protein [Anaerolineaceae bacterium]